MRIWTYKNADEKAHTLSRTSKKRRKRTENGYCVNSPLSLRTMASQDLLIYLKNNSFDSSHQNEQHYLLILFLLKIDQTC